MVGEEAQGSPADAGQHLLLYDGDCGLCDGVVRAVLTWDRRGVFRFTSLQSSVATEQLARLGSRATGLDTFFVITNYRGATPTLLSKARAALFVLAALGWPWKAAAALLSLLPIAWLDRAYDVIAQNRYRILGRSKNCIVPTPEYQRRFLDSGGDVVPRTEVRP